MDSGHLATVADLCSAMGLAFENCGSKVRHIMRVWVTQGVVMEVFSPDDPTMHAYKIIEDQARHAASLGFGSVDEWILDIQSTYGRTSGEIEVRSCTMCCTIHVSCLMLSTNVVRCAGR